MNQPEAEGRLRLPPGEVVLVGSLPFAEEAEAAEWLRAFPLAVSVRTQLPLGESPGDMISEVAHVPPSFTIWPGSIAAKDQLVGPWTYREARARAGEDEGIALARLRIAYRDHLKRLFELSSLPTILMIDEPALLLPGALHEPAGALSLLLPFVQMVRAEGVFCGIHCCQRELSPELSALLAVLPVHIVSLPFSDGNYEPVSSLFHGGRTVCLGHTDEQIEGGADELLRNLRRLAARTGLTVAAIASQLLLSPECGMGFTPVRHAERWIAGLCKMRDQLRVRLFGEGSIVRTAP